MKKSLMITLMMLGLVYAESEPVISIPVDTIEELRPNPCAMIIDAECHVDENGNAVITGHDPCEMFGGDACGIIDPTDIVIPTPIKTKFEQRVEQTLEALNKYEVCVFEASKNKDLKKCKKSFLKTLKKPITKPTLKPVVVEPGEIMTVTEEPKIPEFILEED
jgi:hypothetical protein